MNILDYLKWRGDITLDYDPFNEVDNLCLSYVAYIHLEDIINYKDRLTVKELSERFFSCHTDEEVKSSKSFVGMAPFVLKGMAESKRFKDAVVYNYICINNPDTTEQFGAMMFDLDDGTTYVAYEGTDDSLNGWYEDFKMSYTLVNAQISALEYMNISCKDNKKYRVGGHSKGGNLATYAVLNTSEQIRENIICIYNNDGPGMTEELFNDEVFEEIKDRYVKYMPVADVVGVLMDFDCSKVIVKASSNGIFQHSGLNWQVDVNRFEYADSLNSKSLMIKEISSSMINELNEEEREHIVNTVFESLKEVNCNNFTDMYSSLPVIIDAVRHVSDLDEKARNIVIKTIRLISSNIASDFEDKAKSAAKDTINSITSFIDDKKEAISFKASELIKGRDEIKSFEEDIDKLIDELTEEKR